MMAKGGPFHFKATHCLAVVAFSISFFGSLVTFACDDFLSANSKNPQLDLKTRQLYGRDCAMQDRYTNLKKWYADRGIRISDIAEYKVLRFINRTAWENAKTYQTRPHHIYNPAPATWDVWAGGLEKIFSRENLKGQVSSQIISSNFFAEMNKVLLTDGTQSIKDAETDEQKLPGEYRKAADNSNVAFCETDLQDFNALIESHEKSLVQVQKRIERILGLSFSSFFKKEKIESFTEQQIGAVVRPMGPGCGKDGNGFLISYVTSRNVEVQIARLKAFIKLNLEAYKNNKPLMPPTEFALFAQRWLVTIHPFADGNGRTSRALQDLLLANLDLPFAPTGDLRNDVLDPYEVYVESSYSKAEQMLSMLERCASEMQSGLSTSFACRTTRDLNGY